ncbi:MAG: adenylate kinase [Eubacteriales bacterium]|jgi:adenylate kinase
MKLIFLGAPGAGKGTQAEFVCEALNIPSISTGAIIREAIKTGTEMGNKAKEYTQKGQLVPDEVVIGIIKERLAQEDCRDGYILDGFPRTVPQAKALDDMGIVMDHVISIEVPDEEIVQRMAERRVCEECGATYNLSAKPSKDNVHCDKCGGKLIIRKDDEPETVLSRLKIYHETTEPLKDYYAAKGQCKVVDGTKGMDNTRRQIFEILKVDG